MRVGVDPGVGCRSSIVVPRPWMFKASLKLHTMRSPAVIGPVVVGAIVRPYGFSSPLTGSIADPIIVMLCRWLVTDSPAAIRAVCEERTVTGDCDAEAGAATPIAIAASATAVAASTRRP